jgi:hypothetical protein
VESNNAIDYTERLRTTLNDAVRNNQALSLKEKLLEFSNQFNIVSDTERARTLQEVNRGMHVLAREEQNIARIQDPSELRGRRGRTFGKGGPRRLTAAEIVEKELKRDDREAPRPRQQSTRSERLVVDLTRSSAAPVHRSGLEELTSSSGMPQNPDIEILEEIQVLSVAHNTRSDAHLNKPTQASSSQTERILISSTSYQRKRPAHYQVKLVQPLKRVRKDK